MSTLVLALDRAGRLQTARWKDVNPEERRCGAPEVPSDELSQNDEGARDVRVKRDRRLRRRRRSEDQPA